MGNDEGLAARLLSDFMAELRQLACRLFETHLRLPAKFKDGAADLREITTIGQLLRQTSPCIHAAAKVLLTKDGRGCYGRI